jgi:ComF family protein
VLPWLEPGCERCGLPLASDKDKRCGNCVKSTPAYSCTVAPLKYEFPADRLVQALKFQRQLVAGRVLARLLCKTVMARRMPLPDLLIPVPLHGIRMLRRGFNQSFEIGSYISRRAGIRLATGELRRARHTRAQSGLNQRQRRKNVRGAFQWHGFQRAPQHVALVDDVMTTGTTVQECARVLKNAGAGRVEVWVACRAV